MLYNKINRTFILKSYYYTFLLLNPMCLNFRKKYFISILPSSQTEVHVGPGIHSLVLEIDTGLSSSLLSWILGGREELRNKVSTESISPADLTIGFTLQLSEEPSACLFA